jgi:acyl-CoA hydrolase
MPKRLKDVDWSLSVFMGSLYIDKPEFAESFQINSLFVSAAVRDAVNSGHADYVPVFLSEIPVLFKAGYFTNRCCLVQVSPPDIHGYCSLGVSVDVARSAVNTAKYVIAQVTQNVPGLMATG